MTIERQSPFESPDADEVFRGLTDATRRAILRLLATEPSLSVNEIAANFPEMGRTAISSHLRILREAGLVAEERQGRQRLYGLGPNRADSAVEFLRRVYSASLTTVEGDPSVERRRGPGRPARAQRVG